MTISTNDHALLASDSYKTHTNLNKDVILDGVHYHVLAEYRDKVTGYQGTAYVRKDTGDVVIAHCGTDTARMGVQDIATDAGMAIAGVNAQTADAMAFTKHAMELGKSWDEQHALPFNATVTGHSLGGTLAEITAAKYHLHGDTFNAFGAAGLMQGIPQGGNQVIDYVRATDVVSAASSHYGEVRVFATKDDINALSGARYTNTPFLNVLPGHGPVLGTIQGDAHGIANFITDPKAGTQSILTEDNAIRYQENRVMINAYRNDIHNARTVAAIPGEAITLLGQVTLAAGEKVKEAGQYVGHEVHQGYDAAHKVVSQGIDATKHAGERVGHAVLQTYDSARDHVQRGIGAAKDDINSIFDRMYQGIVKHDDKAVGAAIQDYQRTPDGQAFRQEVHAGYQAYQQQTAQQAQQVQQDALQQQTARAPKGMSR